MLGTGESKNAKQQIIFENKLQCIKNTKAPALNRGFFVKVI
jgi:hypothetical protein